MDARVPLTSDQILDKLNSFAQQESGLAMSMKAQGGVMSVMGVFGREAEDSPMAGGAIHGMGSTLSEALRDALEGT